MSRSRRSRVRRTCQLSRGGERSSFKEAGVEALGRVGGRDAACIASNAESWAVRIFSIRTVDKIRFCSEVSERAGPFHSLRSQPGRVTNGCG